MKSGPIFLKEIKKPLVNTSNPKIPPSSVDFEMTTATKYLSASKPLQDCKLITSNYIDFKINEFLQQKGGFLSEAYLKYVEGKNSRRTQHIGKRSKSGFKIPSPRLMERDFASNLKTY